MTMTEDVGLDSSTIQRMLRPIRAKIAALSRDASLPSSQQQHPHNLNFSRPAQTHYGKSRHRAAYALPASIDTAACAVPSPVRRQSLFLQLLLRDVLKRLMPRKIRVGSRVPSLVELSSFRVGAELEADYGDALDEQSAIYDILPLHSRRFIALSHLMSLMLRVSSVTLLRELIDIFIHYGAHTQAADLMRYAIKLDLKSTIDLQESLLWYWHRAQQLHRCSVVVDALVDAMTLKHVEHPFMQQFCSALDCLWSFKTAQRAVDIMFDRLHFETHASQSWTALLLTTSLEAPVPCWHLQRTLFDWLRRKNTPSSIQLAFALRLILLDTEWPYGSVSMRQCVTKVIRHAVNESNWQNDVGFLLFGFGSIRCVVDLVHALRNISTQMAMEIMVVVVNEYERLRQHSEPITLAECQRLLADLESVVVNRVAGQRNKYYDSEVQMWILATPPATKGTPARRRNDIDSMQTPSRNISEWFATPRSAPGLFSESMLSARKPLKFDDVPIDRLSDLDVDMSDADVSDFSIRLSDHDSDDIGMLTASDEDDEETESLIDVDIDDSLIDVDESASNHDQIVSDYGDDDDDEVIDVKTPKRRLIYDDYPSSPKSGAGLLM